MVCLSLRGCGLHWIKLGGKKSWEVWWWMPKVDKGKCWRGQSPAPKLLVLPGWKSQYDWRICLGIGKKQEKMDFCCCLVAKLCLTLCDPMNGMPCLSVHQYLPEFAQTYVRWVTDAIQPSHPLSSFFSCPLSQHQGLFQWVSSLHQMAKVLELQLQYQSFQYNNQGWVPLCLTGLISLLSKSLLQHHSSKASVLWHSGFFIRWQSCC